jgi:pyruvate kinase
MQGNWTRTKIICTMGPAVRSVEKICELIRAGMNVARINFSHGTHEEHAETIEMIKKARWQMGVPVSIMLDTKGPEVRLGAIEGNCACFQAGHKWHLTSKLLKGNPFEVSVKPPEILKDLEVGMKVLFNDGQMISEVVELTETGCIVELQTAGEVRAGKGINVPNVQLNLPIMGEKDIADIKFGCAQGIDVIAASFVQSAEHILTVKELLREENCSNVWVIAKIENRSGVDNLEHILQVADGIMVARGDLGVEVPLVEVPRLQKMMIRRSYLAGKPAVTATHMLESMVTNARPTRAETSDVANAIYDSTSAVMLSAETAVGRYPVQAVKVMKSIIQEVEKDLHYESFTGQHEGLVYNDVPSAIGLAAVKTAYSSNAKAIFAFTQSGSTPRLIARLRPPIPIVAMTPNDKCFEQMALLWGVVPLHQEGIQSSDEAFKEITTFALDKEIVSYGDFVVVTSGHPFGFPGTTNTMMLESIGDVMARGIESFGERVYGNAITVMAPDHQKPYQVRGQIIVIPYFDDSFIPIAYNSAGVILQNHFADKDSEQRLLEFAEQHKLSVLTRADEAMHNLNDGMLITLDPEKKLVYKGVVI